MADLYGSEERVTDIMSSKPPKSNFDNLLKLTPKEPESHKIHLHTDSKELTKLVLKSKEQEPKFEIVRKIEDPARHLSFRNQNTTNDEYNRNLLSKNPFSLAKLNNNPATRPKVTHIDRMSKTQSSKFITAVKNGLHKKDIY